MMLRGEGGAKNRGAAAGWMLAARENGHDPTPRALDELVSKLDPAEREAADSIVARVGRAALEQTVLPLPESHLAWSEAPRLIEAKPLRYPEDAIEAGARGFVILGVVIGVDGRPRDPVVIMTAQSPGLGLSDRRLGRGRARAFVEDLLPALLQRRYEPARLDGKPVAVNFFFKVTFIGYESTLMNESEEKRILAAAENGDPRAQFVVGALRLNAPNALASPDGYIVASAQAGVPEAQLPWAPACSATETPRERCPGSSGPRGPASRPLTSDTVSPSSSSPPLAKVRELLSRASEGGDRYAARHAIGVLACSSNPAARDPQAAVAVAKRARLDRDTDPLSYAALAAAHASAGDHAEARRAQREAIDRAKRLGWNVDEMAARLAEYERDRPCESPFLPEAGRTVPPGAGT
jgi:hypothetical protein